MNYNKKIKFLARDFLDSKFYKKIFNEINFILILKNFKLKFGLNLHEFLLKIYIKKLRMNCIVVILKIKYNIVLVIF